MSLKQKRSWNRIKEFYSIRIAEIFNHILVFGIRGFRTLTLDEEVHLRTISILCCWY